MRIRRDEKGRATGAHGGIFDEVTETEESYRIRSKTNRAENNRFKEQISRY